jgi:hypothetical protein
LICLWYYTHTDSYPIGLPFPIIGDVHGGDDTRFNGEHPALVIDISDNDAEDGDDDDDDDEGGSSSI